MLAIGTSRPGSGRLRRLGGRVLVVVAAGSAAWTCGRGSELRRTTNAQPSRARTPRTPWTSWQSGLVRRSELQPAPGQSLRQPRRPRGGRRDRPRGRHVRREGPSRQAATAVDGIACLALGQPPGATSGEVHTAGTTQHVFDRDYRRCTMSNARAPSMSVRSRRRAAVRLPGRARRASVASPVEPGRPVRGGLILRRTPGMGLWTGTPVLP